jgi:hypothetical protein
MLCSQIVDVGAHELALRLTQIHEVECDYDKAGDILQLLASMVSSLRSRNMKAPVIAPSAQDELFKAINFAFTSFTDRILLRGGIQPIEDILTERIIFLARVLQFDLGLPEIWTPATCSIAPDLCTRLFHMVVVRCFRCVMHSFDADRMYSFTLEACLGIVLLSSFLWTPSTSSSMVRYFFETNNRLLMKHRGNYGRQDGGSLPHVPDDSALWAPRRCPAGSSREDPSAAPSSGPSSDCREHLVPIWLSRSRRPSLEPPVGVVRVPQRRHGRRRTIACPSPHREHGRPFARGLRCKWHWRTSTHVKINT